MPAIFSSFGNLFYFIHLLMQFVRSLQICLFASFTILVGIAPLIFLVGSSKFMILEMSSLFTKLKSNNCVASTDEFILVILGWFSYFRIAFTSGSSGNLFQIHHFFNVNSVSYIAEVIIEVSCNFFIFRNYFSFFHQYNSVVKTFCFISKEWFAKFAPCGRCFWKHCLNFST